MKKKSSLQLVRHLVPRLRDEGGFLNLRVLFGLFVALAGVFLALLSFGPARTGFAQVTTREQMTLTLAQALGAFQPPACVPGQEMFSDVPASSGFCPYIEELVRRGITGGCGGGKFCPGDPVSRQQMAVFLVKGIFPEPFHIVGTPGEPAFENGWTNVGGRTTVGFYIDATNVVHLKGSLTGGASGSTAFTLPAGYRPSATLLLPVTSGSFVTVTATLQPDGTLHPFCSGGCVGSIGIDGLSFRVGTGGASPINESRSAAPKGLTPDG